MPRKALAPIRGRQGALKRRRPAMRRMFSGLRRRAGPRAAAPPPAGSAAAYDAERALALLRRGADLPGAAFRDGQEEAIRRVVEGRGRLLVVQRTGWGKSFVYFIAAKLLREAGAGPALLVSPLLALMRNQIAAAGRMGLRAERIASDNADEWDAAEERLRRDEIDILLVSPERLGNDRFNAGPLAQIAPRVALLVIDEAHCISDWGHDFRPRYRMIERIARALPPNLRLLATTATANDRVTADLEEALGPGLKVARGDLGRPSLRLQTIRLPRPADRLAWLAERLPSLPGSGIVYTLTVRDAVRVAGWLQSRGLKVAAYTGQTGDERRVELEDALLGNRLKALAATTALGMGFDKPDLGFVVHYQAPGSPIAYYQQVGRAGRALETARGVLLNGEEDADIVDYFIDSAFPERGEAWQTLEALEDAPDGLTLNELCAAVNIRRARVEQTLELLSLESPAPVVREGSNWRLTAIPLHDNFWKRAERLARLRRREQKQMRGYIRLRSGHMKFLVRALDGDAGRIRVPDLPPLPATVDPRLAQEAAAFIRAAGLQIEPRCVWPAGGMPRYGVRGSIPERRRAAPGKALCVWGEQEWGALVRRGKFGDGRYADELVSACAVLVRRWAPRPAPQWATCVPSLRHPELVPDFARRLARALHMPFRAALDKIEARPEQKTMENPIQQARNVDGALAVRAGSLPRGPALLIDDIVDSRWTITVAAWLLRSHGAGEVYPLALAASGARRR